MNHHILNNQNIHRAVLMLSAAAIWCCIGICGHDLWTPDEPRVAGIVLEMAETGQMVIPHLAGEPFIEKPPFYFAIAALMLKLIGPLTGPTAAIRLTTAAFGLGVLLMTFLIAHCLWGEKTGILAAAILLTMEAFVINFQWIRVDAALSFFVIAAVWCFVEVYFKGRKNLLPLAGAFLAGAFLTKGFIGPVLAAFPWFGAAAVRLFSKQDRSNRIKGFIAGHFWMVLVFVLISGAWVVLFYVKGGPLLWKEWFWVNNVGRFTGSVSKGHLRPGDPFYYVIHLAGDTIPWTPLILYWIWRVIRGFIKNKTLSHEEIFLLIWGLGSILLLTLSTAKRGLYLLPVLPVFAVMGAAGIKEMIPRWFNWYAGFWMTFCLVLIRMLGLLPLVPMILPDKMTAQVSRVLVDFSCYHLLAGVWLILLLFLIFRLQRRMSPGHRMALVTAVLIINLMGLPVKAIDREKSMAADIQNFVAGIPEPQRGSTAGIGFSESMRGAFYYYTGWRVPQIRNEDRIKDILFGKDSGFDSLIVSYKDRKHKQKRINPESDLAPLPYRILAETSTGDNQKQKLFWIKGEVLP